MQDASKSYFKPWICVGNITRDNTALTTVGDTQRDTRADRRMGAGAGRRRAHGGERPSIRRGACAGGSLAARRDFEFPRRG